MNSSVGSPARKSNVLHEAGKEDSSVVLENTSFIPKEINFGNKSDAAVGGSVDFIGALEVFIHQARDIHDVCIYQKQDVYAKLCLTSDPENTVSTKIINGGGRNPVFNESLSLNVRTVDSSLKCEVWMLSRVRNYLEDQLLGFALVPISEILLQNGKLEKDVSLSSTDLFHSPAGFVHLTVLYVGAQPEVIPIAQPEIIPDAIETTNTDSVLDSIEFPDPQVVNETNKMVEEYFAFEQEVVISEIDTHKSSEGKDPPQKIESPSSSVSTNERASISLPVTSASSGASKVGNVEHVSPPNDNTKGILSTPSTDTSDATIVKPVVSVKYEPEAKVVQQEIVDLYMKSMQQFTESLAKMKLPVDLEGDAKSTESSSGSEQKTPASKNSGSRVFYGSRAFF